MTDDALFLARTRAGYDEVAAGYAELLPDAEKHAQGFVLAERG